MKQNSPASIAYANSPDVPYIPSAKARGFTAHLVKGSGFYQNDEGQAFIYGYDKNKKFNKIEIAVATLKVCHIFEAKE